MSRTATQYEKGGKEGSRLEISRDCVGLEYSMRKSEAPSPTAPKADGRLNAQSSEAGGPQQPQGHSQGFHAELQDATVGKYLPST